MDVKKILSLGNILTVLFAAFVTAAAFFVWNYIDGKRAEDEFASKLDAESKTEKKAQTPRPAAPPLVSIKSYFYKEAPSDAYPVIAAVTREIPATQAEAGALIDNLMEGPSGAETAEGYFTCLKPDVLIKYVSVKDGVALVNFASKYNDDANSSCIKGAGRVQIVETLKQAVSIKDVVVMIDGLADEGPPQQN